MPVEEEEVPRQIPIFHSSDIRSIRFKHMCIIRFFGFFLNTTQNTQSGKGYAKNHYRATKLQSARLYNS